MITVFGATGFVGRHLLEHCAANRIAAEGTSRRAGLEGFVEYEISAGPERASGFLKAGRGAGVIAVNSGSIDYYKEHIAQTLELNAGIKKLIDILRDKGITPVFLSSDHVFEGLTGNYCEDDPARPATEYGKRKEEIEGYLKASPRDFQIIRLGKLYGYGAGDGTLLTGMLEKLKSGSTIKAAGDQVLAPTSIKDAVAGLLKIISAGTPGTYHISSPETFTVHQIAELCRKAVHQPERLVEKIKISELPLAEKRPLNTTLNSAMTRKLFRLDYRPLEAEIAGLAGLRAQTEYPESSVNP